MIRFQIILSASFGLASALFGNEIIDAGYEKDFVIPTKAGTAAHWPDGSQTGSWSLGFASAFFPWKNFSETSWNGELYGDETKCFKADPKFSLHAGANRSKEAAVIKWTAEKPCVVRLTGRIALLANSDGVRFRVFHNEKEIYRSTLSIIPAQVRDILSGITEPLTLKGGDCIYFVVDPDVGENWKEDVHFVSDYLIQGQTNE